VRKLKRLLRSEVDTSTGRLLRSVGRLEVL